jgi:hypothetical protein
VGVTRLTAPAARARWPEALCAAAPAAAVAVLYHWAAGLREGAAGRFSDLLRRPEAPSHYLEAVAALAARDGSRPAGWFDDDLVRVRYRDPAGWVTYSPELRLDFATDGTLEWGR